MDRATAPGLQAPGKPVIPDEQAARMSPEKNPLKLYKLLPGTNCGQCFLPSCLAFSAAVVSGSKKLTDCPYVTVDASRLVSPNIAAREEPSTVMREERLARLHEQITPIE